jgi:glycopeptide antibiotics resistance protein
MWRRLWLAWIAVILGVTVLPLKNYVGHAHWHLVNWIPFDDHSLALEDVIANIALFAPFGFFFKRSVPSSSPKRVWMRALLMAAILSSSVEAFQVYCHDRNPSMTDVCDNVLGAMLGVWLAMR